MANYTEVQETESVLAQVPHYDVVVGLVTRGQSEVLVARRKPQCQHAGRLEFPGGKRESGESRVEALARELYEEVGITSIISQPLIQCVYTYPTHQVSLDCWLVTEFVGEPYSKEGQEVFWVPISDLKAHEFLSANQGVISALQDAIA